MNTPESHSNPQNAFSLVEILCVISIFALLLSLSVTGFHSIGHSRSVSQSAADLAGTLEFARACALSRNTYVFVGIAEKPEGLVLALAQTRDGTSNFDAAGTWRGESNLTPVDKLRQLQQVKLSDFSNLTATSGPMAARRSVTSPASLANAGNSTVFHWPLNSSASDAVQFKKVIQFDPQGTAILQDGATTLRSIQTLEIGLTPSILTTTITDLSKGQLAAVQLDGVTGVGSVFRP